MKMSCPMWAWYSYYAGEKCRKPDLRCSGHLSSGTQGVRLKLRVEDEMVLLSRFDMWHAVLNRNYLFKNEKEESNRDEEKLSKEEIEKSWERIFDFKAADQDYWGQADEAPIQAVLPKICLEWIEKVDYFKAR